MPEFRLRWSRNGQCLLRWKRKLPVANNCGKKAGEKTADLFAAWDTVFDEDEPRKTQERQDEETRKPDRVSPLGYEHLFVRSDVLEQL